MKNGHESLCEQIDVLLRDGLAVAVPSHWTNLIDEGYIDSLTFVELLDELELKFCISISLDDMEIDDFRSIDRLADFVQRRKEAVAISYCI